MLKIRFPKIIIIVLALTCLLVSVNNANPVRAQDSTILTISPATTTALTCTETVVTVRVEDVVGLYAYDLNLTFNPTAIEILGVENSGWLDTGYTLVNNFDNVAGTISFAMTQVDPSTPRSGNGDLITIRLRAKTAGNPVTLAFSNTPYPNMLSTIDGEEIFFTSFNGTINREDCPPAELSVFPATTTACVGFDKTVKVRVANVIDLFSYSLNLSFDPGAIQVLSVSNGGFLTPYFNEPTNGFDNTTGTISYGTAQNGFTTSPKTGSGDLISITFRAITPLQTVNLVINEASSTLVNWPDVVPIDYNITGNGVINTYDCDPTSVNLLSFTATAAAESIILNWETSNESDNLGYNLYRADTLDGARTRINNTLIPTGVFPGSLEGAAYTYTDTGADLISGFEPNHTYYYWLESVDIRGTTSLDGSSQATTAQSLAEVPSPTSKPPVGATSVPPTRTATSPVIAANSYIVVNTLAPTSLPSPTDRPILTATAAPARVGFTLTPTTPPAAEPTDQSAAPASIQPAAESPSEELTEAGLFQIKNWWTLLVWLAAGIAAGGVYFITKLRAERKEDHK